MSNILINDFKKLDEGFIKACEVVACSYSAEGKFVILDNNNELPLVTKDGNNIIQRIRFEDSTMNFGALQAIQGAARTVAIAADATTGTCILQMSYLKNIKRSEFNKAVEKGIRIAVQEVYEKIDKLSTKATREDLIRVATTSCNNNAEMGNLIMKAYDFAGDNGVVELIKNPNKETTSVLEQLGMKLNSGVSSSFFFNSNKLTYEAEQVAVLCVASWKKDVTVIQYIKQFYQKYGIKKPLLVITERENNELRDTLVEFSQNAKLNICHIGLTAYSEYENVTLLEDIARISGASVFNPIKPDQEIVLGMLDKFVARTTEANLIVSDVSQEVVELISDLELLENKDNNTLNRIRRLKGKSALIEVGGMTPSSITEVYDSYEDGIASVRTTMKDGFCAGGGSTFLYVSKTMNSVMETKEIQKGYELVKKVIQSPFEQLLKNSNRKSTFFGTDYKKESSNTYGVSYNAKTDEISNLLDDGIIDAKLAIKTSLESATDVAIIMLSLGAVVHYPKTEK